MTEYITDGERVEPRTQSEEGSYKLLRLQLMDLFEGHTKNKASALELLERWERGVMGALHLVAPNAMSMKAGFAAAAKQFLEDDNG